MTDEGTSRPAFLLTNNPRRSEIDFDLLSEWIEATATGHLVEDQWSTGSTTKKIEPGDRAFLLRQGVKRRGLFASGHFVSKVFRAPHWGDPDKMANYANVDWDVVLDPVDVLPIERLFDELAEGQWEPQASGSQINPVVVERLETLWSEHGASVRSTPPPEAVGGVLSNRQGRLLDVKLRKQIEDLAQRRLMDRYDGDNWQVEDRRIGNPFDAIAVKDGQRLYLEAKGTVTNGERVIVTRNEVHWARMHPNQCIIGILSGIKIRAEDGSIDEDSGALRIYHWEAFEEDLEPIQYDYFPAPEDEIG